jgi:hypothetical protein
MRKRRNQTAKRIFDFAEDVLLVIEIADTGSLATTLPEATPTK